MFKLTDRKIHADEKSSDVGVWEKGGVEIILPTIREIAIVKMQT